MVRRFKGKCGKATYYTELDAKIALADIARRRDSKHEESRHYYHAMCKGFHTTSEAKRGR